MIVEQIKNRFFEIEQIKEPTRKRFFGYESTEKQTLIVVEAYNQNQAYVFLKECTDYKANTIFFYEYKSMAHLKKKLNKKFTKVYIVYLNGKVEKWEVE